MTADYGEHSERKCTARGGVVVNHSHYECSQPARFQHSAIGAEYFADNREQLKAASKASLQLKDPRKQFELIIRDLMDPIADELLDRALVIAKECDVIVGHFLAHPIATAADKMGRPLVSLALQPTHRSCHYPPSGMPDLGRWLNPLLWRLANQVISGSLLHAADQFYWGDVLYARGVAAKPLRRPSLAAKPLAERLRWILERPASTAAAEKIGAELANEDGCSRIATMVESAANT